jgi:hypothetical protein
VNISLLKKKLFSIGFVHASHVKFASISSNVTAESFEDIESIGRLGKPQNDAGFLKKCS